MKKTLLLSVVASTMIMAGGDIAPVEPVVEAPVVVAEASAWTFGGQLVGYTQTIDQLGNGDLFASESTFAAVGVQLSAVNSDIFAGIGAGVEVSAIEETQDSTEQGINAMRESAGITQAYLTYGFGATSIKLGRQTLPKSLSPFAFSEGWQIFKNTFDAALVVNSSLPSTTLVYAYVKNSNRSVGPALENWEEINPTDAVHMITAQNTSIENLTLTGSFYFAPDMVANLGVIGGGDATILWGDATYKADAFTVGVQGGNIDPDGLDDTTAFGAKIAANLGMFGLSAAYSSVDDGALAMTNFGTGVKTPLYTQSILNQNSISLDADTFKLTASAKALGGKFGLAYINADMGAASRGSVFMGGAGEGTYQEIEVTYKTNITENTTLFAAYVAQSDDRLVDEDQNFVRFWARYNFK